MPDDMNQGRGEDSNTPYGTGNGTHRKKKRKHSEHVLKMSHDHIGHLDRWLDHEMHGMDHEGVHKALHNYRAKHLGPSMQVLKAIHAEHHPERKWEDLEGEDGAEGTGESSESPEGTEGSQEGKTGAESSPGEEGKVNEGQTSETEVCPKCGKKPCVCDKGKKGGADADTEEINERYQDKEKNWKTRSLGHVTKEFITKGLEYGTVRKTKSGVNYLVKGKCPDCGSMPCSCGDEEEKCGAEMKDLNGEHAEMVKSAGEFMKSLSDDPDTPSRYKSLLKHYSGGLTRVSKALRNYGKEQRTGGSGKVLTDEGTMGNAGSMKDKGELQRNKEASPVVEKVVAPVVEKTAEPTIPPEFEERLNGITKMLEQSMGIHLD